MQYKIKIADRQYSDYTVYDNILLRPVELKDKNPVTHKLFDQDVFSVNDEYRPHTFYYQECQKLYPGY